MKLDQRVWQQFSLGAALAIGIPLSGLLLEIDPQKVNAQTFNPPSGLGTPQRTAGGSRSAHSSCGSASKQATFVALSPSRFQGLTVSDRPTVWVSVPKTAAKTLEFSVFDPEQNGIYQANIPLDATAGLVKITLPPTIAALKPGQPYTWTAALVCNPLRRTEDWLTSGGIQKQTLSPGLKSQLAKATLEQQMKLYAQSGYWYEAIDTLVALRRSQPTNPNLTAVWSELLKVAGLPMLNLPIFTAQAPR